MRFSEESWIEQQLDYRFGENCDKWVPFLPSHLKFDANHAHLKHLSTFLPNQKKFAILNGYDRVCSFDESEQAFVAHTKQGDPIGKRQARFANLVYSWGLSCPVVSNWCDAQGWDYAKVLPGLNYLPIIQFSRRKQQRDRVVLFPLDREFMGKGGKNLPMNIDGARFVDKENGIVWRGRYSGTLSNDWCTDIFWAEGLVQKPLSISDEVIRSYHTSMPRWLTVKALAEVPWANVGFTLTNEERAKVDLCSWKKEFIGPYIRNPLSFADQLKYKFLLAMPGNDYASSLYWSLCSNSVVFLVENEWETALDGGLEPWIHYVPVCSTLHDIQDKYEKMMDNPKLCLDIIENANNHMKPFLDNDLRDALDYETLRRYQGRIIPVADLDKTWSYARR
jgi:hypothetical protein